MRLTGQDAERGTFSHRQAVLHDAETGEIVHAARSTSPKATARVRDLQQPAVGDGGARLRVRLQHRCRADTLVLWEAQFGDFVNVAQPIIDQFIAADRAKWGQDSAVVLLLPHGYEGQGPEHSSARLERFLQLCAEGNMRVAYPSTPAQYFHLLRRQAMLHERRPLVLMQPKSLLRLPEAASSLADLASGGFQPVIDDRGCARAPQGRSRASCSARGKIYYDLAGEASARRRRARARRGALSVAGDAGVRASSTCIRTSRKWCGRRRSRRTWARGRYVAPRLRASTGNAMPAPLHRPPGAREPGRGIRRSAQGRAGADRQRGECPGATAGGSEAPKHGAQVLRARLRWLVSARTRRTAFAALMTAVLVRRGAAARSRLHSRFRSAIAKASPPWASGARVARHRRAPGRRGHAAHHLARARAARRDRVPLAHARRRRAEPDRQRAGRGARRDPHGGAARRAPDRRRASVLHARVRLRILQERRGDVPHWPKEELLGDVVKVVRAFRPHIIVAVFSGTARDGHGQHQVAGILAREGYDAAADTVRFPVREFGAAWTPQKFYRGSRFRPAEATLMINVGEFNPALAASYAELAAESRSQHKSQGFGTLRRRGVLWDYVTREHMRVTAASDPKLERSIFEGLDLGARSAAADSSAEGLRREIAFEAVADRQAVAAGEAARVTKRLFNRGKAPITFFSGATGDANSRSGVILPDSSFQWVESTTGGAITQPWWLASPRTGDLFAPSTIGIAEDEREKAGWASVAISRGAQATRTTVRTPIVFHYVDAVRGDVQRPLITAPGISVTFDRTIEIARASTPLDRFVNVTLRSAFGDTTLTSVSLELPGGLTADSVRRAATLAPGGTRTLTFRVRGSLPAGRHRAARRSRSEGSAISQRIYSDRV